MTPNLDLTEYNRLLTEHSPCKIETEEDYQRMLKLAESCVFKELTPEEERLDKLVILIIEDYEKQFMEKLDEIHPGELLKGMLMEREDSIQSLSAATGLSESHIEDLLEGRKPFTRSVSELLGTVIPLSPQAWMNWQSDYDQRIAARIEEGISKSVEITRAAEEERFNIPDFNTEE